MKTLVLANQKGGVGKTAVATLLAYYLAERGQRVLAIDLDHQGNFSKPLRLSGRAVVTPFTADMLMTGPVANLLQLPSQPSSHSLVLVPSDRALLGLERQPQLHTPFARSFRAFIESVDAQFDVCVIDTNPNPDIRLIAALASADFVLSPIQLNQEAMDGVNALLNHDRVGVRKIKTVLNPKLQLMGLLPTLVESNPFQKANFVDVVQRYGPLMIQVGNLPGQYAFLPRRSIVAEAQANAEVLWRMKKTAARDAWKEIEPGMAHIAGLLMPRPENATATTPASTHESAADTATDIGGSHATAT
jgi:chromosome partitioning protein